MQTLRTKEWITDYKTVIASTQNKERKSNTTIQDHIIQTKKYKDWATDMIKQKIYNNAENKAQLSNPNGDIIVGMWQKRLKNEHNGSTHCIYVNLFNNL